MGRAPLYVESREAPGQKKPGDGQLSGVALPIGAQYPGSIGVQLASLLRSVALPNVPPGHGTGTLLPALHRWPFVHSLHAVAPSAFWKVPASHFSQLIEPEAPA